MSLLVVGSVAYDTVTTPFGRRDNALGGSATYFSIAASYFTSVSVVAVVGEDFASADFDLLDSKGVDTSGLVQAQGETFRWAGEYSQDLNSRETLDTQLNVFADFSPSLSAHHRETPYLFLANIHPTLQLDVLSQMERRPRFVALDTMNFWIDGSRDDLSRIVSEVDVLFMDFDEVRSFAREPNVLLAAKRIQAMGPRVVAAKRGEHGALIFDGPSAFAAPAFPLESPVDPTGAGDAFAGGFMGCMAASGETGPDALRRAAMVGAVMGSFAVESFSADRLISLTRDDIEQRFRQLADINRLPGSRYGDLPLRKDD